MLDGLADGCALVAVSAAVYELVAVLTGVSAPFTDYVWAWRLRGSRIVLLVLAVWLGLGWHLFVEMRGVRR